MQIGKGGKEHNRAEQEGRTRQGEESSKGGYASGEASRVSQWREQRGGGVQRVASVFPSRAVSVSMSTQCGDRRGGVELVRGSVGVAW